MRVSSASVAPSGKTAPSVRNIPAYGEASPRAVQSANCAELEDTWLTITSTTTSRPAASAATSAHEPRRGSTVVWSTGSNPASAPSNGTKNGSRCTPPKTPGKAVSRTSCRPAIVPPRRST